MKKSQGVLMWIFFVLSAVFAVMLIVSTVDYVCDYLYLIKDSTTSGVDYLLFDFFYIIAFLPLSVLGLVNSILCIKFSNLKSIKIISNIETILFILGLIFSGMLFFK